MLAPGDLAAFELRPTMSGIAVHIVDAAAELAFVLRDGDIVMSVDGADVDTLEAALSAIKLNRSGNGIGIISAHRTAAHQRSP